MRHSPKPKAVSYNNASQPENKSGLYSNGVIKEHKMHASIIRQRERYVFAYKKSMTTSFVPCVLILKSCYLISDKDK